MKRRIFISKATSEVQELLNSIDQKQDELINHSFLTFEQIPADIPVDYEVIFFGSPRAIIFLKSQYTIPSTSLIACVGSKTAEILNQMGYAVHFTGEQSGKVREVAKDFKKWCDGKKVLFPISSKSRKTVSSVFGDEQKHEVEVYHTEINAKIIEPCDIYVFTSPSNVQGFLMENIVPEGASVIAWGESTAEFLSTHGVTADTTLKNSSMNELLKYLA